MENKTNIKSAEVYFTCDCGYEVYFCLVEENEGDFDNQVCDNCKKGYSAEVKIEGVDL